MKTVTTVPKNARRALNHVRGRSWPPPVPQVLTIVLLSLRDTPLTAGPPNRHPLFTMPAKKTASRANKAKPSTAAAQSAAAAQPAAQPAAQSDNLPPLPDFDELVNVPPPPPKVSTEILKKYSDKPKEIQERIANAFQVFKALYVDIEENRQFYDQIAAVAADSTNDHHEDLIEAVRQINEELREIVNSPFTICTNGCKQALFIQFGLQHANFLRGHAHLMDLKVSFSSLTRAIFSDSPELRIKTAEDNLAQIQSDITRFQAEIKTRQGRFNVTDATDDQVEAELAEQKKIQLKIGNRKGKIFDAEQAVRLAKGEELLPDPHDIPDIDKELLRLKKLIARKNVVGEDEGLDDLKSRRELLVARKNKLTPKKSKKPKSQSPPADQPDQAGPAEPPAKKARTDAVSVSN